MDSFTDSAPTIVMEAEEEFSTSDTPFEDDQSLSEEDKARKVLRGWTGLLPYPCESVEEMQAKLDEIIAKIYISAKAKNWLTLASWDAKLQLWMRMHYPMPKATRTGLIDLFYNLCTLPGLDPQLTRSWADILNSLFMHMNETNKLEPSDIQLDWRPLWRVLKKELYPKARVHEGTRNMVNILLFVAEKSKLFYPPTEVKPMLDTFIPLITRDTCSFIIPVLTSFLPPFNCHLYLPVLLKLWQAFRLTSADERLLEMVADLSQRHLSVTKSVDASVIPPWKDVGIWTDEEWVFLSGKSFDSLHLAGMDLVKNLRGVNKGTVTVQRPKKASNQQHAFAKLLVYSMAVDGEVRDPESGSSSGYIAGSKALDTLDKVMTSKETYYHPSNPGTYPLTSFLFQLATLFGKRWHEEQLSTCETPISRRLTSSIRYEFVKILRTPALLSMFDKDNVSLGYSHAALRCLALLEPSLMMSELLERAYEGLEVVNETHRTTAVLSMLSSISRPLADEKRWLSGQKNIVPLLELAVPGIDLNDPTKTMCTTLFVTNIVQLIKIGDLSGPAPENPPGEAMDVDQDVGSFPEGTEAGGPSMSREDERALTRDSTAGFADWITSLLRRIFALYENLPEEGGRRETTGGRSEETVLKGIKSMMDVICLHLSKPLFDLVLKMVYEYAITNAKANAVRAFGQLVSCLARAYPEETINKFLPHCTRQIEEELMHGASSNRTTSSHQAAPSDTTLHWNISILRNIIGYGGPSLLRHKEELIKLMNLLIDKTKSERGYSGASRFIGRVLSALSSVNPISSRFVNEQEWDDPMLDKCHNLYWGKHYEVTDVDIQWHVPSPEEIDFILEILDRVVAPTLDKLESLLEGPRIPWDHAARNDFCRYLYACRSIWNGLPMLYQEKEKNVVNPCIDEQMDSPELLTTVMDVKAGFLLTDPQDPRYGKALAHKTRFGLLLDRATALLTAGDSQGEDHTDAVLGLVKAYEVYMLDYGNSRSTYDAVLKIYNHARGTMRVWTNEKQVSRLVFLKRAYAYHTARGYMHSMYRQRSDLDDRLLNGLVQLSLSPYTRIRRHAQSVLQKSCNAFIRATAYVLPSLYDSLARGTDPDRMKGALYMLLNGPTALYAIKRLEFFQRHLLALVECQHEEKPSVQKLVQDVANEVNNHLFEEYVHNENYTVNMTRVEEALARVQSCLPSAAIDTALLTSACAKTTTRGVAKVQVVDSTIEALIEIAQRPTTHWRYILMACRFVSKLIRRDAIPSPSLAEFLAKNVLSAQPNIRSLCQRSLSKLTFCIKIRTYAKSDDELWYHEWKNPLQRQVSIDPSRDVLHDILNLRDVYVDKIETGFITWTSSIKAYAHPPEGPFLNWDELSKPALTKLRGVLLEPNFFTSLLNLWGQETNKTGRLQLRTQNFTFAKSIAKTLLVQEDLPPLLSAIDFLLWENDKFKQRAGAELLAGVLRGSKHWSIPMSTELISWIMSRLDRIFAQVNPDTLGIWQDVFLNQLERRDPKRNEPLTQWIQRLSLDFSGDSAFATSKNLSIFGILAGSIGLRFNHLAQPYIDLFFSNMDTGYEEVRQHLAVILHTLEVNQRLLNYPSTDTFLDACHNQVDPLRVRQAPYLDKVKSVVANLDRWRDERLPPPLTSQSQYDKVGLTLLQWFYTAAASPQSPTTFPYFLVLMPEVLRMSELNDKSELQTIAGSYLFVVSATAAPPDYVERILGIFTDWIHSSSSWRSRRVSLPGMIVFFYRNLLAVSPATVQKIMDLLLETLADENVEVREKAAQMLAGLIRVSQRQVINTLKNRFVKVVRKTKLPARSQPEYAESLRKLHAAILGLCALIDAFPYSVESWVPSLITTLADHSTDPPPISTSIRKCASDFKKSHQDTWSKDQLAFDEDSLQSLHTIIVGNSYYA